MISVCIPIYNFDVSTLLTTLSKQVEKYNGEIVAIDDASTIHTLKHENKKTAQKLKNVKYIEINKNAGRSKIRNLFLKYTKYQYLLFLDCDSIITSHTFIKKYVETIRQEHPEVVYGGRVYGNKPSSRKNILRWKHGTSSETKPAHIRKLTPIESFDTNNFLIRRDILEKIKFNEALHKYGHESTLFAHDLKRYGIKVLHIGNPVANGELEENRDFVKKTEQAIENLIYIIKHIELSEEFAEETPIVQKYKNAIEHKSLWWYKILFLLLKYFLKLSLYTGYAPLSFFEFYKFGYFITHYDKIK